MRALRFKDGVVATARLGKLGQGVDYVLRVRPRAHRVLRFLPPTIGRPSLCSPDPQPTGSFTRNGQALYDPCLSLRIDPRVQGNDLHADGKPLIMITGANQGGKSTFLRSLGLAQLMMQAGMFVAAERYAADIVRGVFTHYKREEDATMISGKFDEEVRRHQRARRIRGGRVS